MSRSTEERLDTIAALLRSTRTLVDDDGPELVGNIAASSPLSKGGIAAVLDHSLKVELDATSDELLSLIDTCRRADADDPPEIHLILSSTVFSSALRAIACALARSERVTVSPSSREPFFAEAIVRAFDSRHASIAARRPLRDLHPAGEVFVYGSDETIESVTQEAERRTVHGHGPGFGVAWVNEGADAANALALDIALFDQFGCLSPRVVFFSGDLGAADSFADDLHSALERLEMEMPRGTLSEAELAAIERHNATALISGRVLRGATSLISIGRGALLPPPGRNLHIVPTGEAPLSAFAKSVGPLITNVGIAASPPAFAERSSLAAQLFPEARIARVGEMQCPRLDGPVDTRTKKNANRAPKPGSRF